MSLVPDDPRLTAYALGELEDAERPEIETLLEADSQARAFVEEVRATASILTDHLRTEAVPGLEAEQHLAIETRLEPQPTRPKVRARITLRRWTEIGIAAGLVGVSITLIYPSVRGYQATENGRNFSMAVPPGKYANPEVQVFTDGIAPRLEPGSGEISRARSVSAPPVSAPLGRNHPTSFGLQNADQGQANFNLPNPGQSGAQVGQQPARRLFQPRVPLKKQPGFVNNPVPAEPQAGALGLAASPSYEYSKSKQMHEPALVGARVPADPAATVAVPLREMIEVRRQDMADKAKAEGEAFAPITDNPFLKAVENPLSTFSIDVDTASYANVRSYLNQNIRPPKDAVRIEELVNYFPYNDPSPQGDSAFSVNSEVARCPWDADHRLVRIGLKGRAIASEKRPPSNLVFLIDASGSMDSIDKLPLLRAGMKLLVDQLGENDKVAIVVYAGQEGLALDSTRCDHKAEILSTLEQLQAGGSTNGGRGILLAYDVAVKNFIPGGTNRVILATDGDFNVGITNGPELDRLIEEKRKTGVFLSVLGFGQGNVKHDRMESLADKGNGQYSFIDSIKEARKVLVEEMGGTLVTIAKDVKIQVQFDPAKTSSYRLIGYENRMLAAQDFEDDKKDAGEIGAGQTVTALYEVVPSGQGSATPNQAQQSQARQQAARGNAQLLEVRLRCKTPEGDVSRLFTCPASDEGKDFSAASTDFRFAASVAGFGLLLRDSPYKGTLTWDGVLELASGAVGRDLGGYRAEFLTLIRKAQSLPQP